MPRAEEFSSIHVLNLRGNARTSGELRRAEGDNVFGQGSRAPVAISILVKNPDAPHKGCRILHRDVGDYLSRERKLEILREAGSIAGIDGWRTIEPDCHHDWVNQRDEAFQALYPIGSKEAKAGKTEKRCSGYTAKDFKLLEIRTFTAFRKERAQRTPEIWWTNSLPRRCFEKYIQNPP